MIAASQALLWSAARLWDETGLVLKANLAWFVLALPLHLPLVILLLAGVPAQAVQEDTASLLLPTMIAGLLTLLVPNPVSLGVYALAARVQRQDSPPFSDFVAAVRQNLKLGLVIFALGVFGTLLLGFNAIFYLATQRGPLQLLVAVWVYLLLFWLGIQFYLGPLVAYLHERSLTRLYWRAAKLVLAQPLYTLYFLVVIALVILLCVIAPLLYLVVAMSFVALLSTRALGHLKQKYDPDSDSDEGAA